MIISKDTDNMIYLNKTLEEAEIYTEIDTGGDGINEFTFCDDKGQIYIVKQIEKNVFKLVPKGDAKLENLISFLENVIGFGNFPDEYLSVDDLRKSLIDKKN